MLSSVIIIFNKLSNHNCILSTIKGCLLMKLLKIGILTLFSVCLIFTFSNIYGKSTNKKNINLKFKSDGTFKIVQFADCQDGSSIDPRTVNLMNEILDYEKPDLVVFTGDNIDGSSKTVYEVKKAIDNIAQPVEIRKIPWAIVFGNHDEEHGRMNKKEMMKVYMSYPHNISQPGLSTIDGVGNYNLLIKNSKDNTPVFNVYMLDSRANNHVSQSQVKWYEHTSKALTAKYHKTIPSLMFFHIPLPEWNTVWNSGKAIGEKNEEVCTSNDQNSFFATIAKAGDVIGIFAGHDHTNDYVGDLNGIKLGYSRSIGFKSYGKDGFAKGGRVFLIKESNPYNYETWMRLDSNNFIH